MSIITKNQTIINNSCKSLVKYIKVSNVSYLIVEKEDTISNTLIKHYDNRPTKEYIDQLLKIGCIYHQDPIEITKIKTVPRRVQIDKVIGKGSLLKYFFYPRVDTTDHIDFNNFNKYIIYENQYFLVVDKPHGINLGSIVDHLHNNFTSFLKDWLKKRRLNDNSDHKFNLNNPHLLDSPTRGLCVIAKDPIFLSKFNKLLSDGKVSKIYKAFVPIKENDDSSIEIKPGIYKHFMKSTSYSPKILFDEQDETNSLKECLLKVLKVERKEIYVPLGVKDVSIDLLQNLNFNDVGKGNLRKQTKRLLFNVVDIQLITGRTHQIRTQLSRLGFPLLSDIMYGGKSLNYLLTEDTDLKNYDSLHWPKMIGLIAFNLSFQCPITKEKYDFNIVNK
ncbi:hypothetical protein RB653_003016 [Dictyostelium firmibasis]|uniref:Pseudouridine synthase RsuA/RluA-like domain-containing protein n=1 Tax=Dictyostelium firmibasis TaxID=79012 RepID=A0AAN7TRG5_9MYCE